MLLSEVFIKMGGCASLDKHLPGLSVVLIMINGYITAPEALKALRVTCALNKHFYFICNFPSSISIVLQPRDGTICDVSLSMHFAKPSNHLLMTIPLNPLSHNHEKVWALGMVCASHCIYYYHLPVVIVTCAYLQNKFIRPQKGHLYPPYAPIDLL